MPENPGLGQVLARPTAPAHRHPHPSTLDAAASQVLSACLPGSAPVRRSALDAVLDAPLHSARRSCSCSTARLTAAHVRALLVSGHAARAAGYADRAALAAVGSGAAAAHAPLAERALAYAAIAEAYLATGRLEDALTCARRACEYAAEAGDDRVLAAGHALLSLGLATHGEVAAAQEHLEAAERLRAAHAWGSTTWPLAFATVLLAIRRSDTASMEAALRDLEASGQASTRDHVQRAVLGLGRCHLYGVRGDYPRAISTAQTLTHGSLAPLVPPALLDQAVAVEALSLLQLGNPAAVLTLLHERPSPPTTRCASTSSWRPRTSSSATRVRPCAPPRAASAATHATAWPRCRRCSCAAPSLRRPWG
ncbi:hypothetical protein [Xylanimonas allomyrinae]|uniref:hypothetical protein n=1 Tax=Xylanimonas allomyrinae TaxID=2509459 RepID=UPI0013A61EC3|nr:hypothetical protein [Xylanimonas allomyrinae]